MGGGKGTSSGGGTTQVILSPEQREALGAQTKFLTDVAFPSYAATIGGAGGALAQTMPKALEASQQASDVAQQTGGVQQVSGTAGTALGMSGLASLFDPQYEKGQINAALQAGRESARESQAGQNAMYGAAGGLGSSRMALADRNLSSLNAQRQATAAAEAQARVQANKAAAANQLATLGGQQLTSANQAASARIGYAGAPQDVYSKYASVVFGVPQANTTPSFTGTQGSTSSGGSTSKGFRI